MTKRIKQAIAIARENERARIRNSLKQACIMVMDDKKTYNQASIVTGIPLRTIQRAVSNIRKAGNNHNVDSTYDSPKKATNSFFQHVSSK